MFIPLDTGPQLSLVRWWYQHRQTLSLMANKENRFTKKTGTVVSSVTLQSSSYSVSSVYLLFAALHIHILQIVVTRCNNFYWRTNIVDHPYLNDSNLVFGIIIIVIAIYRSQRMDIAACMAKLLIQRYQKTPLQTLYHWHITTCE